MLAAQQDEADLRPISVGDDNSKIALQQVRDMPNGFDYSGILVGHALMLRVLDQRIASDGDHKCFHRANQNPVTMKPSRTRRSRTAAMCAASLVSTMQCTLTVVISSLAKARS